MMKLSTPIHILFFRNSFNRSFSIYDRFRLGEVAKELPAPFELVYSTQPERTARAFRVGLQHTTGVAADRTGRYPRRAFCRSGHRTGQNPQIRRTNLGRMVLGM